MAVYRRSSEPIGFVERDIPRGTILGWSGSIAAIPSTFRLCDGTRGTPNLLDRFIVGAGSTYAPADLGGTFVHLHDFTGTGHTHFAKAGTELNSGAEIENESSESSISGTTNPPSAIAPYYALALVMYDGRPL